MLACGRRSPGLKIFSQTFHIFSYSLLILWKCISLSFMGVSMTLQWLPMKTLREGDMENMMLILLDKYLAWMVLKHKITFLEFLEFTIKKAAKICQNLHCNGFFRFTYYITSWAYSKKTFLAWTKSSNAKRWLIKYMRLLKSIGGVQQLFVQWYTNKCC